MDSIINYFSLQDFFWLQMKEHLITFGCKKLPKDVHFTISFNDNSQYINFHISKNVSGQNIKPQIKILSISKSQQEDILGFVLQELIRFLLIPIDIEEIKLKHNNNIGFISFESFNTTKMALFIEQILKETFKENYLIKRKSRFILKGEIEKKLESLSVNDEMQQIILDNIVEFGEKSFSDVEAGLLILNDDILPVIRIYEKWYIQRTNYQFREFLSIIVNPTLVDQILWKIKRSIIAIKFANSISDIEGLDKPIHLCFITTPTE